MNYYYVIASLPMLFFGEPPPFSAAEWRRQLRGVLSDEDLAQVEAFLDQRPLPGNRFYEQWQLRIIQLQNAIARARAARLGVEVHPYLKEHPGFDVAIQNAVTHAFTKDNPLEREMELDRCRWQIADELARPHPFGIERLFAFALQLRIAERWAALREEAGLRIVAEFIGRHARWTPEGYQPPSARTP
ncbi:MAG: DUF2764 domain-containing protein [Verrucomicrobiae bacterium]|nr:DUF2764 domain-containing protein [Verrucomicrobiae bacterium]